MNIERMKKLADAIEHGLSAYIEFGMDDFSTERCTVPRNLEKCNTVACIGGHAVLMFGKPGRIISEYAAQELLGLSEGEADYLFYNGWTKCLPWSRHNLGSITRREAAMAIRRMVKCGGIPLEHRL